MAIVGTITVPKSKAISIIENLNRNDFHFLISKIDLIELGSGKESLLKDGLWETGRLFNEEYEVRWRLDGEEYRMTMLTEIGELPSTPDGIDYEQIEDGWDTTEIDIMLWGVYESYSSDTKGFLEVRIPKFLKYPEPEGEQWKKGDGAVIHGVNYLKDGIILYTRFKEVGKNVG